MLAQRAGSVALCSLRPLPCVNRQQSCRAERLVIGRKESVLLPTLPLKGPLVSTGFSKEVHNARDIKVQSSGGGSLIEDNKDTLVNGYLLVSVVYAVAGIGILAVPQKMASAVMSTSLTAVNEYLLRAYGLMSLFTAVLVYSMKEGAGNRALQGDTYKRIGLWVTVHAILAFICSLKSAVTIPTAAMVVKGAIPAILIALYLKAYKSIPVAEVVPNVLSSIKDALTPSNWKAGAFSLLAAAAVVETTAFFVAPEKLATIAFGASLDTIGLSIGRSLYLSVLSMVVGAYTLKDGVEKGLMGQSPFKNLNLAMGVLVLGNGLLLGVVHPQVFKSFFEKKVLTGVAALVVGFYTIFCGYLYANE